ncbi:MAG: DUF2911 domain-containing protein [Chitinophagaceae bacterium]|nr:DUF2911 domain-containing protein [Chitinophagaceae bacterium]
MKCPGRLLILTILVGTFYSCREKQDQSTDQPAKDSNNIIVNNENTINPFAPVDVSPMDMSYYPVEYPKLKMANNNIPAPVVRVVYSRPHLQGRHLFHEVLKYGEKWRLGANESTELELYRDVTVNDTRVKAGRYTLYAVPDSASWTIAFNSNIDSWGLKQDTTRDVHRFQVSAVHNHSGPSIEYFTIVFEKTTTGADMIMAWGDVIARLPLSFK